MSRIEALLLGIMLVLVVGIGVLLLLPGEDGGLGLAGMNQFLSSTLAQLRLTAAKISRDIQAEFSGQAGGTQKIPHGETSNPLNSAVQPAGSYGQAQKDLFQKPVDSLQAP